MWWLWHGDDDNEGDGNTDPQCDKGAYIEDSTIVLPWFKKRLWFWFRNVDPFWLGKDVYKESYS